MRSALEYISTINKCGAVDAKQYMLAYYDSQFNIFNHFNQGIRRPLALVAMHPAEDITSNTMLESRISKFASSGVKDVLGLNLKEYMNLPTDICDMLCRVATTELSKKSAITNAALNNLENSINK